MEELAFWRNVAVVVLSIQGFVVLIVLLALNYLLVRLMNTLHGKTEIYAHKVRTLTHTVNERTQVYSEKSIKPVLAAHKQSARFKHSVRSLFGRDQTHKPTAQGRQDPPVQEPSLPGEHTYAQPAIDNSSSRGRRA